MTADATGYPPGDGSFTVGRPEDGEDAGEKVAAWVAEQRRAAGLLEREDGSEAE
jgi:hypothetical protein